MNFRTWICAPLILLFYVSNAQAQSLEDIWEAIKQNAPDAIELLSGNERDSSEGVTALRLDIRSARFQRRMDEMSRTDSYIEVYQGPEYKIFGHPNNRVLNSDYPVYNHAVRINLNRREKPITIIFWDKDIGQHDFIGYTHLTNTENGKYPIINHINGRKYTVGEVIVEFSTIR